MRVYLDSWLVCHLVCESPSLVPTSLDSGLGGPHEYVTPDSSTEFQALGTYIGLLHGCGSSSAMMFLHFWNILLITSRELQHLIRLPHNPLCHLPICLVRFGYLHDGITGVLILLHECIYMYTQVRAEKTLDA